MTEIKIATMNGVREHTEGEPVELWLTDSGRAVIRSYNECGNNCVDIDLANLVEWLYSGTASEGSLEHARGIAALSITKRN